MGALNLGPDGGRRSYIPPHMRNRPGPPAAVNGGPNGAPASAPAPAPNGAPAVNGLANSAWVAK